MRFENYYNKLLHCYYGKSIGGTLGMPYEGKTNLMNLTFYDPIPTEMVGNDDLDLQVVWLECIRRFGLPIRSKILEEGWMTYIRSMWDEYGVAQRNIRHGLYAPLSGFFDNKFTAGYGSAIRTELWAGLAPANPDLAVRFATEDATVDHAGDGVDATRFIAAFESIAFEEDNLDKIFAKALKYVNPRSRFYAALSDTKKWINQFVDYRTAREHIIAKYGTQNFTDVCVNIPFVMLGLFYGKGDFGRSVCIAVNCGYDSDCNGATCGAILGLLHSNDIPQEWIEPIGNKLVLSPYMVGTHQADLLDEMCMQIASICSDIQEFYQTGLRIIDKPDFLPKYGIYHKPWRNRDFENVKTDEYTSVAALSPFYIALHYPTDIAITVGGEAEYELELVSEKDAEISLEAFMPYPWKVDLSQEKVILLAEQPKRIPLTVFAPNQDKHNYIEHMDISISTNGFTQNGTFGIPVKKQWLVVEKAETFENCPKDVDFNDAEILYEANSFVTVPKGVHYFTIEFKSPAAISEAIVVFEGTRKMRIWFDDELIDETNGEWYVPASHRGPEGILNYRKRVQLQPKWQRVVVEVADGKSGEFFFGIFKPYGHEWLEDVEFRRSFTGS